MSCNVAIHVKVCLLLMFLGSLRFLGSTERVPQKIYRHEYLAHAADSQELLDAMGGLDDDCEPPMKPVHIFSGQPVMQTFFRHSCTGRKCSLKIDSDSFDAQLYKSCLPFFQLCHNDIRNRDTSSRAAVKDALAQLATSVGMPKQAMVSECPCSHISQKDRSQFEFDLIKECWPRDSFCYVSFGSGLLLVDLMVVTDCITKQGCKKVTVLFVDPTYKGFMDFLCEAETPIRLCAAYSQAEQNLLKSKKAGEYCPCQVNNVLFSLSLWLSWLCKIYDAEVDLRLYASSDELISDSAMCETAQALISVDFDTVYPPCKSQKPHLGFPYLHWKDDERYCKDFFKIKDQILKSGGTLQTLFGKDGDVIRQQGRHYKANDGSLMHCYVENDNKTVVVLKNRFICTKESGNDEVHIGDSLTFCQLKPVLRWLPSNDSFDYFFFGKDRELGHDKETQKHLEGLVKQMNALF